MATALTVYLTGTAATTSTTDNTLATTPPASETSTTTKTAKTTGWLYAYSQGTGTTAGASEPPVSDHGWLLDSTLLEGQQIVGGTWTPTVKLSSSSGTLTAIVHVRAYIRSSGGVFTLIADCATGSVSITSTAAAYSPTGAIVGTINFGVGDKLFVDVVVDITANSSASTTATTAVFMNGGVNEQFITPGYQLIPPPASGIGPPGKMNIRSKLNVRDIWRRRNLIRRYAMAVIPPPVYQPILLVSAGPLSDVAAATVTPAFGQATQAGNLLVCCVISCDGNTLTTTSPGWRQAQDIYAVAIWYKPNCVSGEVAPTFTAAATTRMFATLAEFSGPDRTNPLDQHNGNSSGSSPLLVGPSPSNAMAGELVVSVANWHIAAAATATLGADVYGNASATTNLSNNSAASTTYHTDSAYGITDSASGNSDSITCTFPGTTISGSAISIASFLPAVLNPGWKDVASRLALAISGWLDVAARFNLGVAASVWKDAASRLGLAVASWRGTAARLRIAVPAWRDVPARFRLAVQALVDTASRLRLAVGPAWRDTASRFRLTVRGWRDTASRLYLTVQAWRDVQARFRLSVQGWKDAGARFRLAVLAWSLTAARLRIAVSAWRDTGGRFGIRATAFKDLGSRFKVLAGTTAWKDTQGRLRIVSGAWRDTSSRLALSIRSWRDTASRFALAIQGFRFTGSRLALAVQSWRNTPARLHLTVQAWRDLAARVHLGVFATSDRASRLRLSLPSWVNLQGRFRLAVRAWRDIGLRLRLGILSFVTVGARLRIVRGAFLDASARLRIRAASLFDTSSRFRLGFQALFFAAARFRTLALGRSDAAARLVLTSPGVAIPFFFVDGEPFLAALLIPVSADLYILDGRMVIHLGDDRYTRPS